MERVIKHLHGFSGSQILLMENETCSFIRKIQNVERNYERLTALKSVVLVPEIYSYNGMQLDMEYIHGHDMKSYLLIHDTSELIDFIIKSILIFSKNTELKDYTETYYQKLKWLDDNNDFPFTKEELINKLPKILPKSQYHGDMTLENILYGIDRNFYYIDPVTLEYDSWVFDVAKLRQDLNCKWFLRYNPSKIDNKLIDIERKILNQFPIANDDYLLILMLLRVYIYCKKDSIEYNLILKEIWRLWK